MHYKYASKYLFQEFIIELIVGIFKYVTGKVKKDLLVENIDFSGKTMQASKTALI